MSKISIGPEDCGAEETETNSDFGNFCGGSEAEVGAGEGHLEVLPLSFLDECDLAEEEELARSSLKEGFNMPFKISLFFHSWSTLGLKEWQKRQVSCRCMAPKQYIQMIPRSVCSESCPPGNRKAAQHGQPLCCFDCIPCSEGEIANQTGTIECLKCPKTHWPTLSRDACVPKNTEFLSYEDHLGIALAVNALSLSAVSTVVLCIFIKHRNTPIVKANNRNLSYLLLLVLIFCFLCPLMFIGHPSNISCVLRQVAFGVIFSVSISCILAKTVIVVLVFRATKPGSSLKKWLGPTTPYFIVVFGSVVQFLICIVWLTSYPPFVELNMTSHRDRLLNECNEGSFAMFYCMLAYLGLLASMSFLVAFKARKLPDNFNEAKHITFSMLIFMSVWLSFVPAYLSTKGKYITAVEVFAILVSSAGSVVCIFMPKCYIIIWRADMNTKEHMLLKTNFEKRS
ncbi:vomeronasal type-2 receptor 26-like [Protopterus annectens]|uniref:vomeronasal type-2 receptor 26-like n=1 Tax=Protopterus annectens TaxID=7888 RepID=UPI001CF96800|nr:vomeronasal type-2 receptor 26-like [Protopterus annectens]